MSDAQSRSRSRGRDFHSSGRGGVGNIHRSVSGTRENPSIGEDAVSPVRGREAAVPVDRVAHIGRGGAGNIRSPSRDPVSREAAQVELEREREIIERNDANRVMSTGRGGAGNIRDVSKSRSRSRGPDSILSSAVNSIKERSASRGRNLHSSGRGGAGNISSLGEDMASLEIAEEDERKLHPHSEGVHSTGRGGLANMTPQHAPGVEHHPQIAALQGEEFYSSGRGGAGNIRNRSASRDPEGNERKGVAGKLLERITGKHHE